MRPSEKGFGKRLSETRLATRDKDGSVLTQERLSQLVEVKQAAVSEWERGKAEPRFKTVIRLARVLGVDPGWLAFGSVPEGEAPAIIPPEPQQPQPVELQKPSKKRRKGNG